jgi:myo-inositol-1-phosphate synthase
MISQSFTGTTGRTGSSGNHLALNAGGSTRGLAMADTEEQLQEALGKAILLRDQLLQSLKDARITITRGEFFLELAEWNVADLRVKLRRAKEVKP